MTEIQFSFKSRGRRWITESHSHAGVIQTVQSMCMLRLFRTLSILRGCVCAGEKLNSTFSEFVAVVLLSSPAFPHES